MEVDCQKETLVSYSPGLQWEPECSLMKGLSTCLLLHTSIIVILSQRSLQYFRNSTNRISRTTVMLFRISGEDTFQLHCLLPFELRCNSTWRFCFVILDDSSNTDLRPLSPCTYRSTLELFVAFPQNTFVQALLVVPAAPSVESTLGN